MSILFFNLNAPFFFFFRVSSFLTRWNIKNKDFTDDSLFCYLKRSFDEGLFSCNPRMEKYIHSKFFANVPNVSIKGEGVIKVSLSTIKSLRMKNEHQTSKTGLNFKSQLNGIIHSFISIFNFIYLFKFFIFRVSLKSHKFTRNQCTNSHTYQSP